jgi:hypothetical protein
MEEPLEIYNNSIINVCNKNDRSNYQKEYMKQYIKKSPSVICELCGGKYKKYQKYAHITTIKHSFIENKLKETN